MSESASIYSKPVSQSTYSLPFSGGSHQSEAQLPQGEWIEQLRFAYAEAAGDIDEEISLEQWCNSKLRYILDDYVLSNDQMIEYFKQIDANTDDSISWAELVSYIMVHLRSITGNIIEKKLRILFDAPDALTIKQYTRSSICLRAKYIPQLDQILTLTDTQLTFWGTDCTPIRKFSDKDKFVDFCVLSSIFKLAIAKQNRQIIFYDLRGHEKANFFISATLDTNNITKFDAEDTEAALASCKRRRIPLFNTPTAMECNEKDPYIFIGDEEGRVEVFELILGKQSFTSRRVKFHQVHKSAISQILYIPEMDAFASSSVDGTISIWHYIIKTNEFIVEQTFKEPSQLPITGFVFEKYNKDFIYTTTSHCFGCWRWGTLHSQTISTNTQMVASLSIVQITRDAIFLVAITRNNFFAIYRMPDLEICENYFMGLQHELCPPTASLFFNGHLFLVGAFISRWRCENATSDGVHACSAAVVNAYVNDLFQRIITCDAEATVASWDIESGSKEFSFQLEEVGQTVTAFALDLSQRRVAIGYSNGLAYVVTANSGSILTVIEKEHLEGGCLFLSFLTLFGSKKLVGCSGRKTVVLFEEVSGNRMRFDRNFVGHNENIINVICLKGTSLLTVGAERELFLWSVSQQNPTVRFQLPFDPTTASDLPNSEKLFLAGDVAGNIHLMSVESPRPLKSIDVFGMSIKSSITTITLHNFCVYIGNLHGYMKVMTISERNEFEELMMFRPHTMSIINISVSQKTGVVVTSSADQEIRLWSVEPFALIGHLGKPGKWSLRNPSTWKGNWSIEIDPMHFAKPEPPAVVEEEEEEEEEEPEVEEVPELPIFTFNAANSLFKESDEIIESGRELKEKLEMDIRREAKSARIIKPVVAKLNFTELIEARHMENTRPYVESCRSIRPSPRHFRI